MTVRGIEFSTLTLRDALDLAVLIEQEAEERYEELSYQMALHHNPQAAEFFDLMIAAESKHGRQIRARRTQLFGAEPTQVRRAQLFDVEAPDYDEARAGMSVREALESALRSERKAFAFFTAALPHVQDVEVRSLLAELRDEERLHEQLLLRELSKFGDDPSPPLAVLEDDPVPL